MQVFLNKLKSRLTPRAWCIILGLGLLCAFIGKFLVIPNPKPIATDELSRPTHAEQVRSLKNAIARRAAASQMAPTVEPKLIQQHLVAIRDDLATLHFKVALILVLIGASMASLLGKL